MIKSCLIKGNSFICFNYRNSIIELQYVIIIDEYNDDFKLLRNK